VELVAQGVQGGQGGLGALAQGQHRRRVVHAGVNPGHPGRGLGQGPIEARRAHRGLARGVGLGAADGDHPLHKPGQRGVLSGADQGETGLGEPLGLLLGPHGANLGEAQLRRLRAPKPGERALGHGAKAGALAVFVQRGEAEAVAARVEIRGVGQGV
jgi:hypothetical protein